MIKLIDVLQGVTCCMLFTLALRAIQVHLQAKKYWQRGLTKTSYAKYKILYSSICTILLALLVYNYQCRMNSQGQIGLLECIYINPGEELVRNVAIALFINTTLFLGGLHQQLYNGGIKRKFLRFYKKQFQWNLFKKLFIVPVCIQIVFRALLCRIVDPKMQHPSFFTFLSGSLFAISHAINYFSLRNKFGASFASKTIGIQIGYNFIFGLYVSHIFSKSLSLISSLVIQVYANFMGYPEYFQILKGNMHDERVRKTVLFYMCGVLGCLSCCLFL